MASGRDESKILFDPKGNLVGSKEFHAPSLWGDRISQANEYYSLWSQKFRTEELEEAYYGFQWDQSTLPNDYKPYVQNQIFVAIDIKSPAMLFQNPIFTAQPLPITANFDPELAATSAKLKQDTLNYFIVNDRIGMSKSLELAILDAWFRFGIIEVGYSATWEDNPKANKPWLKLDQDELKRGTGETVKKPQRLPEAERIYTKYIPSKNFRVGGIDTHSLEECSWCGYWEYVRSEDVLSNKKFNLEGLDLGSSIARSSDFSESVRALKDEEDLLEQQGDLIRWWKIWDMRSKKRLIYLEESDSIIRETSFKRLPLKALKFRDRLRGWYPLPPTFNWISPQVEINETREAARAHRRRFQRKFIIGAGAFDADELAKIETGGDGTFATSLKTNVAGVILPIPNADLGAQHIQALQVSTDDFDNIAGISGEQRLQPQNTTATQAKIVDARAGIRESRDTNTVKSFLLDIGKEVLLTIRDKFVNDFWIEITSSGSSKDLFSILEPALSEWKSISPEMFGDDDFALNLDVTSLSPLINDQEKAKYIEFISILSSFPFISLSADLVMETANRVGYYNSKVIGVFQKMAQLAELGATGEGSGQESGSGENQIAQRTVAQNSPNTVEQIRNQLNNQGTQ